MRKLLFLLLSLVTFYFVYIYRENIVNYILKHYINDDLIVEYDNNDYYKTNYQYEETNNFYPKEKKDIVNIFYTALNGGWKNVIFFCEDSYPSCIDDVNELASNSKEFSKVNNYVHPFNSYKRLILNYNSLGKMEIKIEKLYTEEEIKTINEIVDKVLKEKLNKVEDLVEKIKIIHDYIIENTAYDEDSAVRVKNKEIINFDAHKANGALINGLAICGGYSDAMAIFLNKLGILNYKLSSDIHIWNYVLVNDNWYHLDLTWDDPVTNTKEQVLLHTFFLITDEELKKMNTIEHNYN